MAFLVTTFETHPNDDQLSFAFHESMEEGRDIYFLAKFSKETNNAKNIAEDVFGNFLDIIKSSEFKNSYDSFEEGLKAANQELEKQSSSISGVPEIMISFLDFQKLYLSQVGNAEGYLIREGAVSQITETIVDSEPIFSNVLTGDLHLGDIIIASSGRILRSLTTNQVLDIFEQNNYENGTALLKQELKNLSEEDLLVSVLGINPIKKPKNKSGFFSEMVTKGASSLKRNKPEKIIIEPEQIEENLIDTSLSEEYKEELPLETIVTSENLIDEETTTETEQEEVFIEQEEPKKQRKSPSNTIIKKLPKIHLSNVKNIFKKDNPQKKILGLAGAILILFLFMLGASSIRNYESESTINLKKDLSVARDAMRRADEFLYQGNRKLANELLQVAEKSVTTVLNSTSKELRSEARYLKADIQAKKLSAENAVKVSPQLIANLGAKNTGIKSQDLNELRGNLYVNDVTQVFKTIRSIVESGTQLTNQEAILASDSRPDQNTLIFLTNTPRLIEYREGGVTPMNTQDKVWKGGVDINTYGRFTYILDPVENQIWKYERKRTNYSAAIPYNKTADLSRAVSMAIDGNVFILSDDGTLQKLFRGSNENYAFRDLPSFPFSGKNLRILTHSGHDFLYVLDPDNSRVLVFQKGDRFATYKKQVFFDIPNAVDFTINDSGQKVNILTHDNIYEFSL